MNEEQNGSACFTVQSKPTDVAIDNPYFNAVARGVNQAAPGVELAGEALVLFGELATGLPIGFVAKLGTSDSAFADSQAATAGVVMRNPADIRFTQDTVDAVFKDGRKVETLVNDLRSGTTAAENVTPIRTFVQGGAEFTLDNRRLLAATLAGTEVATAPVGAVTPTIAKEIAKKMTTTSGGRAVSILKGMISVIR